MGLGHEFTDPDLPGELGLLISESNQRYETDPRLVRRQAAPR